MGEICCSASAHVEHSVVLSNIFEPQLWVVVTLAMCKGSLTLSETDISNMDKDPT